jgi:hypothetical protein
MSNNPQAVRGGDGALGLVAKGEDSTATGVSKPRPWLQKVFPFHVALVALLCLLVFLTERGRIPDPDLWWHMRNAEQLLTTGSLPRFDTYSFTVNGNPWINHEWLAEIPYYLAWHAGGPAGVQLLVVVLLQAIFLGLFYLCWKTSGNLKGSFVVCCVAVLLAVVSFGPRTILFGYAYVLILLIVLQRFRATGRGPLWVLPFLFCLWINTHGSWSVGLILFGIVMASGLVQGRWGAVEAVRWSPAQLRKLLLTMGASIGSLFVNPYGYRLVLYPYDLAFRQKLNISHVAEWVSVNFHDFRGKMVLVVLAAMLFAALWGRHRWRLEELALALFGLYCGLTYIRFLFLAALLVSPLLAKFLDFLPPYQPEIDKPALNALILGGALAITVVFFPSSAKLERTISEQYPAEILPYLNSHKLSGRTLNFYLWGGWLEWNAREVKTFIDSRVDVFEYAGVFKDYIDLLGLKNALSIVDKYRIQYILFPPDEPLTTLLQHDPNWRPIFSGKVCLLFERVGPIPAGAAAAEAIPIPASP